VIQDPHAGRRERWWRSAFVIVATIYVTLLLLGLLVDVLGGFIQILLVVFVAWLLAFILSPVVSAMERWLNAPRGVAIGVAYAVALLVIGFALFVSASSIATSMGELAQDFPQTRMRIETTLRNVQVAISFGAFEPKLVDIYRDVEATVVGVVGSALGKVPQVSAAILGSLVIVIILSLYMLADSAGILAKMSRTVPSRYSDEVEILQRTVSKAFGGFLRAQVILAAVQLVLTVAVILLLGLPYGFLIAAISALSMLIPFFGPPLALVPPVVATLIFEPGWALVVVPILLVVQTILVNWLQPRLMRDALGMHPILVLVGILVGAQIAGVWGALFAIPILAVLNVFFNYAINLRTLEDAAESPEEVIEEVRQEVPEATREEVIAIAAERVEESGEADDAATEADLRESRPDELDREGSPG
jgi:predicted PurR-regulated permease PerM